MGKSTNLPSTVISQASCLTRIDVSWSFLLGTLSYLLLFNSVIKHAPRYDTAMASWEYFSKTRLPSNNLLGLSSPHKISSKIEIAYLLFEVCLRISKRGMDVMEILFHQPFSHQKTLRKFLKKKKKNSKQLYT